MARKGPPPGYITAGEANKILGGMLYKHVKAGRLKRYKPRTREYGFYRQDDVIRLAAIDKAFFERGQIMVAHVVKTEKLAKLRATFLLFGYYSFCICPADTS